VRDQKSGGVLILIGLFRLSKALLLIAGGIATLKLLRPGMADTLVRWVQDFPVMTGHAFLERATAKLTRLPPRRIEELAIAQFAYAAVFIAEGTGLVLRRVWAEWLTIIVTTSFIPFEIYETFKRVTAIRVALLVINIAIVIYLIWRRVESRRHESHTRFFHRRS
jgi:uncharacterized membrane protein (DUF2068 family)